jgi:uncharacterized protein (DUF2141 family)
MGRGVTVLKPPRQEGDFRQVEVVTRGICRAGEGAGNLCPVHHREFPMIQRTFLAAFLFASAASHAGDLTIQVTDIRTADGVVKVSLLDSAAGWDNQAPPVAANGARPSGGEATIAFRDVKPGSYAVMVMHDENDNGSLDTNFIGMPKEGYGFSNNPDVMRRATFEEARFTVGAEAQTVTVRLR